MEDLLGNLSLSSTGAFGLPRIFNIGPFTHSAEAEEYSEIEEAIIEVSEERDIDLESPTDDELDEIVIGTMFKIYPGNSDTDAALRRNLFNCISDQASKDWSREFSSVTTGNQGVYEDLVLRIKYCIGLIE